jgi:hypothetical protein
MTQTVETSRMINLKQIESLVAGGAFRRLVERVLANGRCVGQACRERLQTPEVVRVAALGLGLQRTVELTYRPAPVGRALCEALLDAEARHAFDGPHACVPAAIALAALRRWKAQHDECGMEADTRLGDAALRIRASLQSALRGEGAVDPDETDRQIVRWQLPGGPSPTLPGGSYHGRGHAFHRMHPLAA